MNNTQTSNAGANGEFAGRVQEQWCQNSDSDYVITGLLTRDTVPELWAYLSSWQPQANTVALSLKNIQRIDSSGMVMLIHLIQHAKKQNCHIMLSSVPVELKMLFQLSNIENMMMSHIKN